MPAGRHTGTIGKTSNLCHASLISDHYGMQGTLHKQGSLKATLVVCKPANV